MRGDGVRAQTLLALLVLAMSPAPAINGVITLCTGPVMPAAAFAVSRRGGVGGGSGAPTLSGEVDAECGCLLESSCSHGAGGVAAARRLQLLEKAVVHHDRRHEDRAADEMAFIRTMMFPACDPLTAERAAVARSTCVREGGIARRGLSRGRLSARISRSNSTSAIGDYGFRAAGSSLSVIAKRSARSWTPDGTVLRAVRGLRETNDLVLHGSSTAHGTGIGCAQYMSLASRDLTMMNKLVMPRLLSPKQTNAACIRGELVSRLRGLEGRYEMAKSTNSFPLLMLRKDQQDSEPSLADHTSVLPALGTDGDYGNDGGATLGAFHAPKAHIEVLEVPASDSWLEEGNAEDKEMPQLVAALLRRVAEEGDRSTEEDCEVVGTGKDIQRSAFHAQRRPKVSLADYAERMCKYGACSPGCLGLALVYMDRFLKQTEGYRLTGLNVHRLLLSCVLVGTKQWDDTHYNNAFWAKVGGVANAELNSLERHLLAKLDFSLLVDKSQWHAYRRTLVAWDSVLQQGGAHNTSPAAVMARHELAEALQSPYVRHSLIFEWSRAALVNSRLDLEQTLPADSIVDGAQNGVADAAAYSPEGPGSNVLAADESETHEPPSEDIYMAAQRQMYGGRVRTGSVERSARQQLTGGASQQLTGAARVDSMSALASASMPFFQRSYVVPLKRAALA